MEGSVEYGDSSGDAREAMIVYWGASVQVGE